MRLAIALIFAAMVVPASAAPSCWFVGDEWAFRWVEGESPGHNMARTRDGKMVECYLWRSVSDEWPLVMECGEESYPMHYKGDDLFVDGHGLFRESCGTSV